jgi:hypothetical protein
MVAEREGFELTLRFGVDLTHIESKSVSASSKWLTSTSVSGPDPEPANECKSLVVGFTLKDIWNV